MTSEKTSGEINLKRKRTGELDTQNRMITGDLEASLHRQNRMITVVGATGLLVAIVIGYTA